MISTDDIPDIPQLSYNTSLFTNMLGLGLDHTVNISALSPFNTARVFNPGWNSGWSLKQNTTVEQPPPQPTPTPTPGGKKPVERLLQYFVVDPDPNLAKVAPEHCLLKQGTRIVTVDDRSFLLDLAQELTGVLQEHNVTIATLTWENEKGESKPFKGRKLSDLDVIIAQVKAYS